MPFKRKTKTKKVVRKRPAKNTKKVVIRTTRHQPIPMELSDSFQLAWQGNIPSGAIMAGTTGLQLQLGANVLYPSATHGPFYVGNLNTEWYQTSNFSPLGGPTYLQPTTCPTGLLSFMSYSATSVSLYSRYTVTGISYDFTIIPTTVPVMVVVSPDKPSSGSAGPSTTNIAELIDYPWSKSKICTPYNSLGSNRIKGYIDIAKYLGITRDVLMSDSSYSGFSDEQGVTLAPSYTANAAVQLVLQIMNMDATVSTSPTGLTAKIQYHVTFRDPAAKLLSD